MNSKVQNVIGIRKVAVVSTVLVIMGVTSILQSQQVKAGISTAVRVTTEANRWLSYNPFTLTTDTGLGDMATSGETGTVDSSLSPDEIDRSMLMIVRPPWCMRPPIRIPYRPPLRSPYRPGLF